MRVAYIQIHITNVQATSARTGVRNSFDVGTSVSPKVLSGEGRVAGPLSGTAWAALEYDAAPAAAPRNTHAAVRSEALRRLPLR
jgi:hypothetical protein